MYLQKDPTFNRVKTPNIADQGGTNRITTSTSSPQVSLTGDVDMSAHLAVGANASINAVHTLRVIESLGATGQPGAGVNSRLINAVGTFGNTVGAPNLQWVNLFSQLSTGGMAANSTNSGFSLWFQVTHDASFKMGSAAGTGLFGAYGQVFIGVSGATSANTPQVAFAEGVRGQAIINSGNTGTVADQAVGGKFIADQEGKGTVTTVIGVWGEAYVWERTAGNAGAVTNLKAGYLRTWDNGVAADNPVTNVWGLHIEMVDNNITTTQTAVTGLDVDLSGVTKAKTITTPIGLRVQAWGSGPTYTNGPYGISQEGTANANWFAGPTYFGETSRIAATTADDAKVTIDQQSTTAAIPPLILDQADVDQDMMELITTIGTGNAIEAIGAKVLTTTHFVKVTIPGALTRYFPVGTIA